MNLSNTPVTKMIARGSLFAALISGCAALSAPAFAADYDAPPQAAFSVRGVDFTSPQAVGHLKRQLVRVVTGMCVPDQDGAHLKNADERACYAAAVQDGLAQIASRQQQAMRERTIRLAGSGTAASAGL